MQVQNKWVFITGAASGFGYETSIALAKQGCNIIATDIATDKLPAVVKEVEALNVKCLSFALDVTDNEQFQAVAVQVIEQVGCPDIVINNAGIAFIGELMDTSPEMFKKVLDVNVLGLLHGTQAFLPHMKARNTEAKIVNVASASSRVGQPCLSAYATSKFAAEGFSHVLKLELADSPISVLSVHPGFSNSNMAETTPIGANFAAEDHATLMKFYLKTCHPRDVAKAIVAGIKSDALSIFPGTGGKTAQIVRWLLPESLLIKALRFSARDNGYLPKA